MFHVAVVMGMMFERTFRKNVIAGYTGVDCIKQHFGYRSVEKCAANAVYGSRIVVKGQ